MGCCSSSSVEDEHQPLLSVGENSQTTNPVKSPFPVKERAPPPPSNDSIKIIEGISKTYLTTSNTNENQNSDNQLYIKEVKKKTKTLQVKDIFSLPKLAKSDVSNEIDLQFLRNILQSNLTIISEEYDKMNVAKATNLIVSLDYLNNTLA